MAFRKKKPQKNELFPAPWVLQLTVIGFILYVVFVDYHSGGPTQEEVLLEESQVGITMVDAMLGKGEPVRYGDTVKVTYKISVPFRGVIAQSEEPISLTLGKDSLHPAIEQAVNGMRPGGMRKLVLVPAITRHTYETPPVIPIPEGVKVYVELGIVP